MSPALRLISVAVPVPYLDSLTYSVPDRWSELPPVGARVRVPVGGRMLVGCVVGHDALLGPETEPREVAEILDRHPFLPPPVVDLCRWVAEYYVAGIGDAIGVAMPPGSRRASSIRTQRVVAATAHGLAALEADSATRQAPPDHPGPTPRQRAVLEMLAGAPAGLSTSALRERGVSADVVRRLAARGLAATREEATERDPFAQAALADLTHDPARELTGEQVAAVATLTALADAQQFRVALLHGVTGSGKTEIYLRLAQHVVGQRRQVLLLVPEIALTPSAAALFRSAFGARVAIQHSALSDGERHDQWQRIHRGDVDVVVGTRSAVFAPLATPGLIIVDEEHDTSYKQDETPRYHGRDVAVVRGRSAGALVVLGSATPSLETYANAVAGRYTHIALERRVLDRPLASVRLVNMREEYADEGPDVVISRPLAAAIEERLARREQVLVLLNRRGYATAVFCRQCGDTFECPNCSVSLTVHRRRGGWTARCHYCNYSMAVPKTCRKCAAPYLEHAGFGTERIEQQLVERFPGARIRRVDRDAVRRKGALTSVLSRFAAGDIDVLVGTQMIAKGHDFPRVTLVGVISADVGLGLADFRAAERTFQLLTQVAGRAGRGERTGEAIVQTLYPEHYSIQVACRQDYPAFYERELVYRRSMRYPPAVALISALVRGRTFDQAMHTAAALVRRLEPAAGRVPFTLLGPAPAPLARLRGEHRVQFFLKGTRRVAMREAVRDALAEMPEARKRVTVDVDPLNVL
ncbi:MAG: primosomal protein N' [Acidobacteria bacterium]|nr:primosomal protein N' [Acidobacteriota bacterium]